MNFAHEQRGQRVDDNDATQTQTEISGQDNEGHLEKSSNSDSGIR